MVPLGGCVPQSRYALVNLQVFEYQPAVVQNTHTFLEVQLPIDQAAGRRQYLIVFMGAGLGEGPCCLLGQIEGGAVVGCGAVGLCGEGLAPFALGTLEVEVDGVVGDVLLRTLVLLVGVELERAVNCVSQNLLGRS